MTTTTISAVDLEGVTTTTTDPEGAWNMCFGPYETRESVLAECERQSRAPQDYARACVHEARAQGFDCDPDAAYKSLCKQLDQEES